MCQADLSARRWLRGVLVFSIVAWIGSSTTAVAQTGTIYSVIHSFDGASGGDGAFPGAGTLNPTSPLSRVVYGTTPAGGNGGNGTIYSIDTRTNQETAIYMGFGSGDGVGTGPSSTLVPSPDGSLLYGTTLNGAFAYNIAQNTAAPLGALPTAFAPGSATPLVLGGSVYVTSETGGANGQGAIYQFTNGVAAPVHSFAGGSAGSDPEGGLIAYQNTVYGTTSGSASNTGGTLYSYNLSTGSYNVLHTFGAGDHPVAAPLLVGYEITPTTWIEDPTLYGISGTMLYSYNLTTGTFDDLHTFNPSTDGSDPLESSLTWQSSVLYGTTSLGGAAGAGTAFSFDLTDDQYVVLHNFGSVAGDGLNPSGGLLFNINNLLYGTTANGGANGDGTVFTIEGEFPIPEPTLLAAVTLAVPLLRWRRR